MKKFGVLFCILAIIDAIWLAAVLGEIYFFLATFVFTKDIDTGKAIVASAVGFYFVLTLPDFFEDSLNLIREYKSFKNGGYIYVDRG